MFLNLVIFNIDKSRDVRTQEELDGYIKAGVFNQKIVIQAVIEECLNRAVQLNIEYLDLNEKAWETERDFVSYKPDVKIESEEILESGRLKTTKGFYEIKATCIEPREFIYIKAEQVRVLNSKWIKSYILFSTPIRYCLIPVDLILRNGESLYWSGMGGKECYKIDKKIITIWNNFSRPLEFMHTPRCKH